MLRAAPLRTSRQALLSRPALLHSPSRNLSDRLPSRYQPPPPDELDEPIPVQNEFREGVTHVVNFYSRFFKYSALTFVTVATALYLGWEGTHQYIEHVSLAAPEGDDPYEWTGELERWTGSPSGTDPSLGYKGRHAVRAAWMALHWSNEPDLSVVESSVAAGEQTGNAFDRQLHKGLSYLASALETARASAAGKSAEGAASQADVMNPIIVDLLTLSGIVMDRLATPSALTAARPILEQVHAYHVNEGHTSAAARLGVKLGDVCARLGESEAAVKYWRGSLSTLGIEDSHLTVTHGRPGAGITFPSSPAQQRIAASALLSLSAHYASTRNFPAAKDVETVGLSLIAHQLMNVGNENTTPDRLLHHLFLYYRATILLMHYAEVTYAENQFKGGLTGFVGNTNTSTAGLGWSNSRWSLWPFSRSSSSAPPATAPSSPIPHVLGALEGATLASEEIATLLTSTPPATAQPQSFVPSPTTDGLKAISTALMRGFHTGANIPIPPMMMMGGGQKDSGGRIISGGTAPPPPSTPLSDSFTNDKRLKRVAETLLRQSKRASASALQLRGILYEEQASSTSSGHWEAERAGADVKALEMYERALGWVGGGPDGRTGEGAMESEWRGVWERYVRVRERVLERERGTGTGGAA